MPLEWKKTVVNHEGRRITVTHWARHNPHELLKAISSEPLERQGKHPIVTKHAFGRHELAVRAITKSIPALQNFVELKKLAKKRAAIVEMPVALIEERGEAPKIVTLWKKQTSSLLLYLQDPNISIAEKEQAGLSAVRKLAQLHALNYVHGHAAPSNFLVQPNGSVRLVDPTLVARTYNLLHRNPEFIRELVSFSDYFLGVVRKFHQTTDDRKLRTRLKAEYEKALERYRDKR